MNRSKLLSAGLLVVVGSGLHAQAPPSPTAGVATVATAQVQPPPAETAPPPVVAPPPAVTPPPLAPEFFLPGPVAEPAADSSLATRSTLTGEHLAAYAGA